MKNVIVYENPDAEGGISIVVPAEKFRGRVLLKPEVTQDVYDTVEVATGETDKDGNPVLREEKRKRTEIVEPAQYRPETDHELLERVAQKDVPHGRKYSIMPAAEAYERRRSALSQT